MPSLRAMGTYAVALCAAVTNFAPRVAAAPTMVQSRQSGGSFWMADIQRQGTVWGNDGYKVFRNVADYGTDGDAIQKAIDDATGGQKGRCTNDPWCDSSTVAPALVYVPPGTYNVKTPIKMAYYTQLIGDANNRPVIQADPSFTGMAVLDADPYNSTGLNYWTNQNNFFRQVRNFVIDLTQMPETAGAGIHWQVAQATSLQNIKFNMHQMSSNNKQQGIFMDNGSGGFFSDLEFVGGLYGAFVGSQQFTSRNLVFNGCGTGMYMNWNWGWTISNAEFNDCTVGLDMAAAPQNQSVGSVVLSDSTFTNTKIGVNSSYAEDMVPKSGGNLILDNVDLSGTTVGVQYNDGTQMLAAGKVGSWATGTGYNRNVNTKGAMQADSTRGAQAVNIPNKPTSLLSGGAIYGKSRPQYADVPSSSFKSAKSAGCKGDGSTDDTQCIQTFLDSIQQGQIAYFDHGAYLVRNTIRVPSNIAIVGEIWPLIVADGSQGSNFTDANNPAPVFQVGQPGDKGTVEISDMIFETKGSAPGAIMVEWNLASSNGTSGMSGMWDTHVRIGGSYGTGLDSVHCPKTQGANPNPACQGVFMMFHATPKSSGIYLENTWFWVADHDLDLNSPTQISIYSGRGMLIESGGPVWLWGTASEHSILYNYQFIRAKDIFGGFMQSETPYFQPEPFAPAPLQFNMKYDDPTFTVCQGNATDVPCKDAWGLRILDSTGIVIYSTGMYSFFNNYEQPCVSGQNCQENMIHITNSEVSMYAVSTKAAVNMIVDDSATSSPVLDADHRSNFCATIAYYLTSQ